MRKSLWTITSSSGLSATGAVVPLVQVGAQLLNIYMDWTDPSGGPTQSYIFNWYCVGVGIGVGASKISLPVDLRFSTANMWSKGSPVYIMPLGPNYLVKKDFESLWRGNIIILSGSAELFIGLPTMGASVSLLFFGCPVPPVVPALMAILPQQIALAKGVAALAGSDMGAPDVASGSIVAWAGLPRPKFMGV